MNNLIKKWHFFAFLGLFSGFLYTGICILKDARIDYVIGHFLCILPIFCNLTKIKQFARKDGI
jgi:hypothetical protein